MTFVPVDRLPEKGPNAPKTPHKKNAEHLKEFLKMNVKYAKMDFGPLEYISTESARASTANLIRWYGLPIKATVINGELYLINLELEGPRNEHT